VRFVRAGDLPAGCCSALHQVPALRDRKSANPTNQRSDGEEGKLTMRAFPAFEVPVLIEKRADTSFYDAGPGRINNRCQ